MTDASEVENTAVRLNREDTALLLAHDWDAFGDRIADDVVAEDRRLGLKMKDDTDRESFLAGLKIVMGIGISDIKSTPLAVRGERLALSRVSFYGPEGPDGFLVENLQVLEYDEDGRQCAVIFFDLDDFAAAIDELDERYHRGEGNRQR